MGRAFGVGKDSCWGRVHVHQGEEEEHWERAGRAFQHQHEACDFILSTRQSLMVLAGLTWPQSAGVVRLQVWDPRPVMGWQRCLGVRASGLIQRLSVAESDDPVL